MLTGYILIAYSGCMIKKDQFNKDELEVIFDVLNVYDPDDISHVYPAMGHQQFKDDVNKLWGKILKMLDYSDNNTHSDMLEVKKWE